jgi:hypothetical protein
VTAGIPLSGEVLTDPGQRLVGMLLDGSMQQFVPAVTAALQEVGSRCWDNVSRCVAGGVSQLRWRVWVP